MNMMTPNEWKHLVQFKVEIMFSIKIPAPLRLSQFVERGDIGQYSCSVHAPGSIPGISKIYSGEIKLDIAEVMDNTLLIQ